MTRRRKRRRWRRNWSQLQYNLPQKCSRVVLVAKAIVHFFPVNKEKEDEQKKVEGNKQQEEDEIGTTIWSSVAMLGSCTCRPKQYFLFSKRGGGGGDYNYKTVFCSNAADLYSWQRQLFLSSEQGGGGEG